MDGQIPECAPPAAPDNSAAPCAAVTIPPTSDVVPFSNLLSPGVLFSGDELAGLRAGTFTPAEEAAICARAEDAAIARGYAVRRGDLGSRQTAPRVEDPIALREKLIAGIVFGLSFSIVAGSVGAVVAKWLGWWQ